MKFFPAGVVAFGLLCVNVVCAQTEPKFPVKPIRIVIPFSPGGSTDIIVRMMQSRLTELLGVPITPDNRPGANGILGMEIVAKAPPDGHTIAITSTGHVINPSVYSKMPYDTMKDFAPIGLATEAASFVTVPAALPAYSMKELIALAKRRPGEMNFASSGIANVQHLMGEQLAAITGTKMVHVPYKGGGPALLDLVAGQVHFMFCSPSGLQYIRQGRLRALAIGSETRQPHLPDVPTLIESGFPGFRAGEWWGIYAPAGTPVSVVNRLNTEFVKALATQDIKQRLTDLGFELGSMSAADFDRYQRAEYDRWGQIARAAKVRVE
jgi:tripartite-type tricarboxylate transporter receptor subunit TctC